MENLRKAVRRKIVETKNSKKNLIKEDLIIRNRLNLIAEGNPLRTKRDYRRFADNLLSEVFYMNSQGYNKTLISEGLWDFITGLFSNTGTGVVEYVKERFANYVLSYMGLPDGFLKNAIGIWFANVPITELFSMLSDCPKLVKSLSDALAEAYADKLADEKLGDSAFYDTLRNVLFAQIKEGRFDDIIGNVLSAIICPLLRGMAPKMADIQDALRDGAIGGVSGKASSTAGSTSSSNPMSMLGNMFGGSSSTPKPSYSTPTTS